MVPGRARNLDFTLQLLEDSAEKAVGFGKAPFGWDFKMGRGPHGLLGMR